MTTEKDLLKRIITIDMALEKDRLTKKDKKMFLKRKEGLENELKQLRERE